jgi:hypothetical protein
MLFSMIGGRLGELDSTRSAYDTAELAKKLSTLAARLRSTIR